MRAALALTFVFALGCHSDGLGPNDDGDLGDHRGADLSIGNDFGGDVACSGFTDSASCAAAGCVPAGCAGCGTTNFDGCFEPGAPTPICEPPPCHPLDCSTHSTQADCDADPACYSLFNQALCDCAGNDCCPEVFESCENGPVECAPMDGTGFCPAAPMCDGPYLPAYEGGCQLGCVEAALCGV